MSSNLVVILAKMNVRQLLSGTAGKNDAKRLGAKPRKSKRPRGRVIAQQCSKKRKDGWMNKKGT